VRRWCRTCLVAALSLLGSNSAIARDTNWPDTPLGRTQVLALLQTLNADLLSHDSATLTLERWCATHHIASPARVVAIRVRDARKPLPADLRARLAIGADEPVR